jgi:hypothetical protein
MRLRILVTIVALVASTLTISAGLALADHTTPPDRAVTGISEMRAFPYPQARYDVCNTDFQPVEPFSPRLEFDATFLNDGTDSATEHWRAQWEIRQLGVGAVAGGNWVHQNQGPHARNPNKMEVMQTTVWRLEAGHYTYTAQLLGDESGNAVDAECTFVVLNADGTVPEPPRRSR